MDDDKRKSARILIVEDEPMIALFVEEALFDSGFDIAGVAGTLGEALALIELGGFDAAILDARLNGVDATPVAAALTARGLPFIVTSGYSSGQRPEFFGAAPYLQKPYRPERLVEALKDIL